jgi:hypothetical protein
LLPFFAGWFKRTAPLSFLYFYKQRNQYSTTTTGLASRIGKVDIVNGECGEWGENENRYEAIAGAG